MERDRARLKRELFTFFGLTFLITWGLGAVLLLAQTWLEALVGPIDSHHWLFMVAVYAPAMAALATSFAFGGVSGVRAWLGGLFRRCHPIWLLVSFCALPTIWAAWAIVGAVFGIDRFPVRVEQLAAAYPAEALLTWRILRDPGPLGEEPGFRGYALPRLLGLMRPATAALALGLIWAVWHVPSFFVSGLNQSAFNFGWFMAALVGTSFVMTWLYLRASGNVIVAGVIPHLAANSLGTAVPGMFQADQGGAVWGGVCLTAAAILLIVERRRFFTPACAQSSSAA